MKLKIFVDDLRVKPSFFDKVFRDGESFLAYLQENPNIEIAHLSLDHDLGENKIDGYELVKQLVSKKANIKKVTFHTDNYIGLKNMFYFLKSAQKAGAISDEIEIDPCKYSSINGGYEPTIYKVAY